MQYFVVFKDDGTITIENGWGDVCQRMSVEEFFDMLERNTDNHEYIVRYDEFRKRFTIRWWNGSRYEVELNDSGKKSLESGQYDSNINRLFLLAGINMQNENQKMNDCYPKEEEIDRYHLDILQNRNFSFSEYKQKFKRDIRELDGDIDSFLTDMILGGIEPTLVALVLMVIIFATGIVLTLSQGLMYLLISAVGVFLVPIVYSVVMAIGVPIRRIKRLFRTISFQKDRKNIIKSLQKKLSQYKNLNIEKMLENNGNQEDELSDSVAKVSEEVLRIEKIGAASDAARKANNGIFYDDDFEKPKNQERVYCIGRIFKNKKDRND